MNFEDELDAIEISPEQMTQAWFVLLPEDDSERATMMTRLYGARHPKWPKCRAVHLLAHPQCAACSARTGLNVHHIVPFHIDPARELDPANLITLCESRGCHFTFGHFMNWSLANPNVEQDAARYYQSFTDARRAAQ